MGQKVHPYGFRIGVTKTWRSRWFAKADYAKLLHEDLKLRESLLERLKAAGVSSVEVDRPGNKLRVTIRTSRPGIIIGRKGAEIEKLKQELTRSLCRNPSRCNWKSAWPSGAPCARPSIRRCGLAARESRSACPAA
jgi:small subunit ribosomal protein S3